MEKFLLWLSRLVRDKQQSSSSTAEPMEEETLAHYQRDLFYPVCIGDVFEERYEVLCKLGFGSKSTIWFCRDVQ